MNRQQSCKPIKGNDDADGNKFINKWNKYRNSQTGPHTNSQLF